MFNSDIPFKTKTEVLKWYETNRPEWFLEYPKARIEISKSNFSGSTRLLKRENDDNVDGFLAYLTELNLARLLLEKGVTDLKYEPAGTSEVDLMFANIAISVKNLLPKDYEKREGVLVEEMKEEGITKTSLQHKTIPFSDVIIEVEKNEMGTYTYARTEIGHSGFLDSDIYQMSPLMKYLSKFEDIECEGFKKVMFVGVHTSDFAHYYARDIGEWYFDNLKKPIFENDMSWYLKMFLKEKKQDSIDALVFIWPPSELIWPDTCFTDVIKEKERMLFYASDEAFLQRLKSFFV